MDVARNVYTGKHVLIAYSWAGAVHSASNSGLQWHGAGEDIVGDTHLSSHSLPGDGACTYHTYSTHMMYYSKLCTHSIIGPSVVYSGNVSDTWYL